MDNLAATGEATSSVTETILSFAREHVIALVCTLFAVVFGLFVTHVCKRRSKGTKGTATVSGEEPESIPRLPSGRVRKRDIVRYYGKRMIRKAGMELGQFRKKPKERVINIAKRFLQGPEIPERQLYREPPDAFLEADYLEGGDPNVPSEVLYLLKSVRAFGHFEKPLFMELCKHVETKFVPAGAILFRPGQVDDSIYVVKNGRLKVYIMEPDGTELPLKLAGTGDSVHSMLSILDAVTGHPKPFKTVAAKAVRDTYVLQVSSKAFQKFFEDNPDSMLRMVQIVMLRLQRVTFLALNQFLGLGRELINQKPSLPGQHCVSALKQLRPSHHREGPVKSQGYDDFPPSVSQTSLDSDSDTDPINTTSRPPSHSGKGRPRQTRAQDSGSSGSKSPLAIRDECVKSTDSEVLSDDGSGRGKLKKTVAIDTTQNEHFSHRLIPAQSPEFDNVMNQARVDRQEFSSEGVYLSDNGLPPSQSTGNQSPTNVFEQTKKDGSLKRGLNSNLKFSHFASMESGEVLTAATNDLIRILQLQDGSLLKSRIQLIEVPGDSLLGLEGDLESCVYFIATGRLKVFRHHGADVDAQAQDLLYVAYPGEFCGVLSALTGEPSFITIKAAVDSHLIAITKTNLYHIISEQPLAICGLAYDLVQRLSPALRQIDFALDWMELEAGRALYRQGDEANAAYIILNGRVRSVVRKNDGKKELADEFGRGEAIGVVEVMTQSTCATTVHAIRDTELACLPAGLLNTIKLKHPQVVSRLIQILGERILGNYSRLASPISSISTASLAGSLMSSDTKKHMVSNLSTVAVVPITSDVPLSDFTKELCAAVSSIAPALKLTSSLIEKELGSTALESVHEYRLRTWLGHQEDNHRIVLYQADADLSPWTARCIRQADCILLVGLAEKTLSESMSHIVKQVESISIRVQKELVLLHRENVSHPSGTVKWLNALGWLSAHFHVRCPDYFFPQKHSMKSSVVHPPDKHSDFSRLARRLTGTSVGVVLGGGGARGISHVGTLKAFTEAGIPIDMIGGTSIGAFVGALYCEERDAEKVERRARPWSMGMAGYLDKILDITYPSTSYFTGRAFNNLIHKVFGEKQIEDLWIPYFCVTTDITESKMRVHTAGSLWRYVRASMSLSGFLPPLCDPVDGHLLLDGGYVNNLPADVMSDQGAEKIIAVDVGSQDNNDLTNYGDHISGWYILWNKLNPLAQKIRVPSLTEIQSRLAYVSCIRQLERVKQDGMCEYVRPPIDGISTLQFGSFDTIMPLGYQHCKVLVAGWQKSQDMQHLFSTLSDEESVKKQRNILHLEKFESMSKMQRSDSVRSLVALTAQIPRFRQSSEDEIDGGGYWSNPEDQMMYLSNDGEDSPTHSEPSGSPDVVKRSSPLTAWSDSEMM